MKFFFDLLCIKDNIHWGKVEDLNPIFSESLSKTLTTQLIPPKVHNEDSTEPGES